MVPCRYMYSICSHGACVVHGMVLLQVPCTVYPLHTMVCMVYRIWYYVCTYLRRYIMWCRCTPQDVLSSQLSWHDILCCRDAPTSCACICSSTLVPTYHGMYHIPYILWYIGYVGTWYHGRYMYSICSHGACVVLTQDLLSCDHIT